MGDMLPSYGKVHAVGHPEIGALLMDDVLVEEKCDGSQISFGLRGGELLMRSKGAQLYADSPNKQFAPGIRTILALQPLLHEGWVYRGEHLHAPHSNALTYSRVPKGHIAIFDIMIGLETFLSYDDKVIEAKRIGLETVPRLFEGRVASFEEFMKFLAIDSFLGGVKIEGVVVKNYKKFGGDHKIMVGKFVSEAFKEVHKQMWGESNPSQASFVEKMIEGLKTEARWTKAVQHLTDAGELEHSPRDIGKLIREVPEDIKTEMEWEIKEQLFKHFWPYISRGVTRGLPEFYKELLAKSAFEKKDEGV